MLTIREVSSEHCIVLAWKQLIEGYCLEVPSELCYIITMIAIKAIHMTLPLDKEIRDGLWF